MTRKYTPEQLAARAAYNREWRKRKAEHIKAYEAKTRKRRLRLRKIRREANPSLYCERDRAYRRRNTEHHRAYTRAWTARNTDRKRAANAAWRARNPNYRLRRRIRESWRAWTRICAVSRRGEGA